MAPEKNTRLKPRQATLLFGSRGRPPLFLTTTKNEKGKSLMLNEQTLQTLNALKLFGMAKSFTDKVAHPSSADLSHPEFFGLIVQDEKTYRDNLRLKRLLLNAKLINRCLEDIDYKHPRGLNTTLLESPPRWLRSTKPCSHRPSGVAKVSSLAPLATSPPAWDTPCFVCVPRVCLKCCSKPKPMALISKLLTA
jgi:hypothetical protein